MNPNTLKKRSKRLSWLLRHGAIEAGLPMDEAGFARIEDVLRVGRLSRAQLDAIVALNDKQRLEVRGERAELELAETSFTGRAMRFCVDRARATLGLVETDVERVVERAKRVYREVEDVSELKAGRVRQIARGTMAMLSERALIRAETEVAVKGDKINLG